MKVKEVISNLIGNTELKLSRNFSVRELFNSVTAVEYDICNYPLSVAKTIKVINNLTEICQVLEEIRAAYTNKPIFVTSGYRCPRLNELVNGHKFSYHMDGRAVDITSSESDDFSDLCECVQFILDGRKGWYYEINDEKKYIHIHH